MQISASYTCPGFSHVKIKSEKFYGQFGNIRSIKPAGVSLLLVKLGICTVLANLTSLLIGILRIPLLQALFP